MEDWNGVFTSKIPKLGDVLSRFLQDLRRDPDRQDPVKNPLTLATKPALQRNASRVVETVKNIWRENMMARLVDGTEEKAQKDKIIIHDSQMIKRILQNYETWRRLEQDSRRDERRNTINFRLRCQSFRADLEFPWDISKKNTEELIRSSGIRDWEEDYKYLQLQLTINQPSYIAGSLLMTNCQLNKQFKTAD